MILFCTHSSSVVCRHRPEMNIVRTLIFYIGTSGTRMTHSRANTFAQIPNYADLIWSIVSRIHLSKFRWSSPIEVGASQRHYWNFLPSQLLNLIPNKQCLLIMQYVFSIYIRPNYNWLQYLSVEYFGNELMCVLWKIYISKCFIKRTFGSW